MNPKTVVSFFFILHSCSVPFYHKLWAKALLFVKATLFVWILEISQYN